MFERKQNNFKTPDLSKLQEVVIDFRTKIYIEVGADPEEAKSRYLSKLEAKNKVNIVSRKPAPTAQ
jgi:hypothetical protein